MKSTSIWRTASSLTALGKEGRGRPPPPQAGLPGPRRGGEGPPGPGRGRGGRSDAAGGGEERLGRRRADEEKGRGHGPALRLPRVRPLLESETRAGDAQGSDALPVRPRPCPVRGARPQLEVSQDGDAGSRGKCGQWGLMPARWVPGGGVGWVPATEPGAGEWSGSQGWSPWDTKCGLSGLSPRRSPPWAGCWEGGSRGLGCRPWRGRSGGRRGQLSGPGRQVRVWGVGNTDRC